MARQKKSKEALVVKRLFGPKPSDEKVTDVTSDTGGLAEMQRMPVPKKRLVSKKIIAVAPDQRCMDILAKHWHTIRELSLVKYSEDKIYRGYSAEDVLLETFEYVTRDEKAIGANEEEVINLFIYRFDNLMWVAKMDKILERQILAAGEVDFSNYINNDEDTE